MGKFDGVLFVTDYDDTYFDQKLRVSSENREAAQYFISEGGYFTFATGRSRRTFSPQIQQQGLVFNAPVVLGNGGNIFDFSRGEYLCRTTLSPAVMPLVEELFTRFPELGIEGYRGEDVCVCNPNMVTQFHMERVGIPFTLCDSLSEFPAPLDKIILEQDRPYLEQAEGYIREHWDKVCEAIFTHRYLFELTDLGADKGAMVGKVAEYLGVAPEHVYCMGDNYNDLPMLKRSAIPFAPANCIQELKDWGARVLGHCDDNAVAEAIGILDGIY